MNDIQGDVRALTAEVAELKRQLEDRKGLVNGSTNILKVEGMGSMWNGIAIGIALGATILGVGWISTKLQAQDIAVSQAEAYQKAVYALAPRFAAEIDAELQKQQESERVHANPDHHRTAASPAAASTPAAGHPSDGPSEERRRD